ncbi:MAG: trypsin-like peptidase domain-containing protein [Clostridia bacterium]|nr:trypsin-like peptidase domain-containing protein [Clostridia bacterium]
MEYNTGKKRRGVGASVLIACTAMAVVIGLFAGVILMNSTMQYRTPKAAEATAAPETQHIVLNEATASPEAMAIPEAATPEAEATEVPFTVTASPEAASVTTEHANASAGFAYEGQYTRAQVVELAAPSVVGIDGIFEVTASYWGMPQTYETTGSGSGVILTADGYIATCAHVVDGAKKLTVTLNDDTSYEATIVGTDARNDLAIIKIDAEGLTPAVLGDSDMLTVGEDVIAIGNPLGELRGTATSGIISAVKRNITVENTEMELVQTDAAISPGNSGGGLFNASGKLIGIVNAKVSDTSAEGLGFAIPVNSVVKEINDLLNYGYVTGRAALGVYTQNVSLSNGYGYFSYGGTRCVQITEVVAGSAAEAAGLKAGDLIMEVDGKTIGSNSDLSDAIDAYNAGDTATVTIRRDNERMTVTVTFGEYKPEN